MMPISVQESPAKITTSTRLSMHPFITEEEICGIKVYDVEMQSLVLHMEALMAKIDEIIVAEI